MVAPYRECTKCHSTAHVQTVNFMLCEFHLKGKHKTRLGTRGNSIISYISKYMPSSLPGFPQCLFMIETHYMFKKHLKGYMKFSNKVNNAIAQRQSRILREKSQSDPY